MIERDAGVAPDQRIEFRIGVHLGDVVEESDGVLMGFGTDSNPTHWKKLSSKVERTNYAMVYQMTNEYDRPLGCESFAEQDSAGDEPLQRLPPRLDQPREQIITVATQKIKGHKRGLRFAALGQERAGVAPPVVAEHDRLSVAVSTLRPRTAAAAATPDVESTRR